MEVECLGGVFLFPFFFLGIIRRVLGFSECYFASLSAMDTYDGEHSHDSTRLYLVISGW